MSLASLPPGPKGDLLRGNLPELLRDRTEFLSRCAREYGDVVPLRFGPRRAVLLSDPALIEDVLVARHQVFVKPYALRLDRVTFENGRQGDEAGFWRGRMAPAFARPRLAVYGDAMVALAERRLATWQDGDTIDLYAEMMQLTLEIIAKTLFATDVTDEAGAVGAALEELMEAFFDRLRTLFLIPARLPTPGNRRRQRAAGRLDAFLDGLIAQRRAAGEAGDDLLSMLLRVQRDSPGSLTDAQLREEVMTLFLAGHETTALAVTWAWHLLAHHPAVEAKLLTEFAALGDRSPTAADRPRLRYAEWVVSEAMRLYPPLWVIARVATQAAPLNGYRVPAGTVVLMSPWVAHRDPRHFDRPDVFDPDRWADGLSRRLPRYAYFPFGGGPRVCIGGGFAMTEAVLLLATIGRRVRLAPVPGHPVRPRPSITLRPERGVPMVVHRR